MPFMKFFDDVKETAKTPEIGGYREIKPEGTGDFQASRSFWDKLFGAEIFSFPKEHPEDRPKIVGESIKPPFPATEEREERHEPRSKEAIDAKEIPGYEEHSPEILQAAEKDASENGEKDADAGKQTETENNLEKTVDQYVDDLKNKSECPETIPNRPFEASDLKKLPPEEVAKQREEFIANKADLKKQWEKEHGRPWPKYEHDVYSANGKLIRKAGSDYDAHHIQPLSMGGKNEVKNITPLNAEVHYDKQGIHSQDSPYSKLDKMLGGADS